MSGGKNQDTVNLNKAKPNPNSINNSMPNYRRFTHDLTGSSTGLRSLLGSYSITFQAQAGSTPPLLLLFLVNLRY